MLKKLKAIFINQAIRKLVGVCLTVLGSAAVYFGRGFLLASSSVNNGVLLALGLLSAIGLFALGKKFFPQREDFRNYNKDYLDGMLWSWEWKPRGKADGLPGLNPPKCAKCRMELSPMLTDDAKLLYYCQDRNCGAVYETHFSDYEEYGLFIRRKIQQFVDTGKYRPRMRKFRRD